MLTFFSYAVFAVSASVEAAHFIIKGMIRRGTARGLGLCYEETDGFHAGAFWLASFAFPFLTLAIFAGAMWSHQVSGRYWTWAPAETGSLLVWVVLTLYLHSKEIPGFKSVPAPVFNLTGFVFIIAMTFFSPASLPFNAI
jgi:ABC-type transport system involved in cytochrome c biogenesis permease subunit